MSWQGKPSGPPVSLLVGIPCLLLVLAGFQLVGDCPLHPDPAPKAPAPAVAPITSR